MQLRRLALLGLIMIAGCGPTTPSPSQGLATRCDGSPDRGVLPDWARAGFSDPQPAIAHVFTATGDIVAILFGDPLSSPPSPGHSNKILWVSQGPSATAGLTISAQRMDGTTLLGGPADVRLDHFPGPSTVDMPEPGCWRLTLSGPDWTEVLDLQYVAPS